MSNKMGHVIYADCLAEMTDEELVAEWAAGASLPQTAWRDAVVREVRSRELNLDGDANESAVHFQDERKPRRVVPPEGCFYQR